jgi:hypothetical protein
MGTSCGIISEGTRKGLCLMVWANHGAGHFQRWQRRAMAQPDDPVLLGADHEVGPFRLDIKTPTLPGGVTYEIEIPLPIRQGEWSRSSNHGSSPFPRRSAERDRGGSPGSLG